MLLMIIIRFQCLIIYLISYNSLKINGNISPMYYVMNKFDLSHICNHRSND